jgi:uncharacterized membrane protein
MIRKTIYSILFVCLFAFIGFSQTGSGRPTPTPTPRPTPRPTPGPTVYPTPTRTPIVNPTPVRTPRPPPPPPPAKILWTDDCDPRTDSERCSITPREAVTAGFYDVIKSVNAKIIYKIPESKEELAEYKVVIVSLCSDESNENLVSLIKEYLQSGGSAFILGGNTCQSGGYPTSWWASQLTKDFGVTFGSQDDYKVAWADVVGTHPTTSKLKKMYFSQHAFLNISNPAESILNVNSQPIAAVYNGIGAFVALGDDVGFGWNPNNWDNFGATDNFTFWRNSLRWLISQSKIKKSKSTTSGEDSETSAGLTVIVKQKDVEIFIDDISYDVRYKKSPFKFDSLLPGTYTIRVEKAGYKSETRTVTLKHKQKLPVKFELAPILTRKRNL